MPKPTACTAPVDIKYTNNVDNTLQSHDSGNVQPRKYPVPGVHLGGGGGICPLLNPMCLPLEFALHTPTLHGAPPLKF